ncbi:MAG: hypothetical protein JWM80_4421 [Cyanobacteria bacterium RYN_339]|nr:hypothetical protein [Cyanobacteria bacterium RYN_339]
MNLYVRLGVFGVLGLAACAPVNVVVEQQPALRAVSSKLLTSASLAGVARAPVALAGAESVKDGVLVGSAGKVISNDGASVISNDGASLITNDGAGLRLLAAEGDMAELPLAGAVAVARDARTLRLLPYVKPAATDAQGKFTLKGLPAGVTVLVEVLFVGRQGKALRVTSLVHVEQTAKPLAVGLASTLATAALTKGKSNGQIYLMKQADIENTAAAMEGAMDKDQAHRREAATALALPVDAKGDVVMSQDAPVAPAASMAAQADALGKADPAVAQQVNQRLDVLDKPVAEDQKQLIAAIDDAAKGGQPLGPAPTPPAVSVPSPPVATPEPLPSLLPPPTPGPTSLPSPTPTPVFLPTPVPTFAATPVPTFLPAGGGPQILGVAPLLAPNGSLVTLNCVNAGDVRGTLTVKYLGRNSVVVDSESWTDNSVTFYVTEPMLSAAGALDPIPLTVTITTAKRQVSGPASFNGSNRQTF